MKALQLGYTIYNYCDKARSNVAKDPATADPVPPECDLDDKQDQGQY
jgi:hypothetical protein